MCGGLYSGSTSPHGSAFVVNALESHSDGGYRRHFSTVPSAQRYTVNTEAVMDHRWHPALHIMETCSAVT